MSSAVRAALLLILGVAVAGAVIWWFSTQAPAPAPAVQVAAPPQLPASSAVAAEPAIQHPVEEAAGPLAAGQVDAALAELLGRKAVASFLQTSDFPRRFAATVDNLGRAHAPVALWPVNPIGGRFTVQELPDGPVIGADNAARYTPLVLLAEGVDTARAAQLYLRMYPLLQRAHEELGYPKRYFNDRLVEVIDVLLATPEVDGPVKLRLVEVKGPIPSERPWVRYEYADPALESLTAGQKILVRAGPVNARRLKAKLAEFRGHVAKGAPKR
ncbi:MAG: DUF3014 domain-containing protein [Ramlibacter sp.]|nr:DUF3014 domain-containing protein [Ramlibacter sp.]